MKQSISTDHIGRRTLAGQAIYTKFVLRLYDFIVLTISNRWIWKCPTPILINHYDHHLSANHLDVGVGTGYFLDHGHYPITSPRIVLFDLNPNTLEYTTQRIARFAAESHVVNVLEPIAHKGLAKFDSVGINYLIHCLPGAGISDKSVVFDHLKGLMNDDGTLFGSTILSGDVPKSWMAKRTMAFYNGKGIFSNQYDGLGDLKMELEKRFREVEIEVFGCVAVFAASRLVDRE
ncbi:hypothetical protein V1527DRAFT_472843 [Lipomyces starkeyi]